MDVGLGVLREIQVNDGVDVRDIKTTGSDVGSNQNVTGTSTELVQGTETSRLRETTVQRNGAHPQGTEKNSNSLRLQDGPSKDDYRLAVELVAEIDEVEVLVHVGDEEVIRYQS